MLDNIIIGISIGIGILALIYYRGAVIIIKDMVSYRRYKLGLGDEIGRHARFRT